MHMVTPRNTRLNCLISLFYVARHKAT